MKVGGYTYRLHQLWNAYRAAPSQHDLDEVRVVLSPGEINLFLMMQPSEQAHSIAVMRRLKTRDAVEQELLVAALLHDVGKSLYPLRAWERVLIVLVGAFSPNLLARWGRGEPRGWRRPFVVAQQHPAWGADMAARQGTAPLAVELIRQHQNYLPDNEVYCIEILLRELQVADNRA